MEGWWSPVKVDLFFINTIFTTNYSLTFPSARTTTNTNIYIYILVFVVVRAEGNVNE